MRQPHQPHLIFLIGKEVPTFIWENSSFQALRQRYEVEFWNIGDILFDGLPKCAYGELQDGIAKECPSLESLCTLLSQVDRRRTMLVVFDTMVHCRRNAERVLREITAQNCDYVFVDITNSFGVETDLHWTKSWLRRFKRLSPLGFRNRRIWYWKSVKPPRFALVASRMREVDHRIRGLNTRFIRAHSRDFETFLELSRQTATTQHHGRFGVFIDQAMTGCSDHVYDGYAPQVTVDEYYPRLGDFLKRLCHQMGLERFEVSLHPSNTLTCPTVKNALRHDCFNVSKGSTGRLIRDCAVVVSHHSSAFGLAVLFGKPVAFFCPAEPGVLRDETFIVDYARVLGRKVNYPNTDPIDYGLNQKAHERFLRRYVKEPDTPLRSVFEVLDDQLRLAFQRETPPGTSHTRGMTSSLSGTGR